MPISAAAIVPPPPANVLVLRSKFLEAWITPLGARLMQLWWLGRDATQAQNEYARPLTLGFARPEDYAADKASIGAVCGRYANRIANAQLKRDGVITNLDVNHGMGHCIHGGSLGFGQRLWRVEFCNDHCVELRLYSAAGDMGFLGNCHAKVRYCLQEGVEEGVAAGMKETPTPTLIWTAEACVDQPCPINLVQHSYWNLAAQATTSAIGTEATGHNGGHIAGHFLQIGARAYHPNAADELPLPAQDVAGTPMDFYAGRVLQKEDVALLDHALVLERNFPALFNPHEKHSAQRPVVEVARLSRDGLCMRLATDRPYLHVYAAKNLQANAHALGGVLGHPHASGAGLCLETEDLPNGPALGADVWYGLGRNYRHESRFSFSWDKLPA